MIHTHHSQNSVNAQTVHLQYSDTADNANTIQTIYESSNPQISLVKTPRKQSNSINTDLKSVCILLKSASPKHQDILLSLSQGNSLLSHNSSYDVIDPIPIIQVEHNCLWCNQTVPKSSSPILLKTSNNSLYSTEKPVIHASCFSEIKTHISEILDQPEVISFTI